MSRKHRCRHSTYKIKPFCTAFFVDALHLNTGLWMIVNAVHMDAPNTNAVYMNALHMNAT